MELVQPPLPAAVPDPLLPPEPPLPEGAGRRQQLARELGARGERCGRELAALLQALGWSPRAEPQSGTALCPYDENHRMPKSSLEKHVATCRLRKLGYSKEEADVCDPTFFYGEARTSTFVIDKDLQSQIIKQARENAQNGKDGAYSAGAYSLLPAEVPQNHKHAICDLTQADRLAIYDYALEETKKQRSRAQASAIDSDLFEDLAAKVNQDGSQKGPKSHLEILAEMRDYKRRRQSYRAKNVHITKKSYTEVIRDVISVHMEELIHHWQEDEPEDAEIQEQASSSNSLKSVVRVESRRSESVNYMRSESVDSKQSAGIRRDVERSRHRRDHSRSPHKEKERSPHKEKERSPHKHKEKDSRKKKERDEERHHKRRK